jgi:hypothetical protein
MFRTSVQNNDPLPEYAVLPASVRRGKMFADGTP